MKADRRDAKRKQKAKDKTMRGNRDWQHSQPRPPSRKTLKGPSRA